MGENRRPKEQSHFAVIRTVNGHVLLVIPIYNSLKLGLLRPFSDFQTLCAFEYAAAFQVVTTSRLQLASVALKRWSCQINSQSCQLKFMVLENPSRLADLYCQFKAQSSLKLLDKSDDFNSADFQKLLTQSKHQSSKAYFFTGPIFEGHKCITIIIVIRQKVGVGDIWLSSFTCNLGDDKGRYYLSFCLAIAISFKACGISRRAQS